MSVHATAEGNTIRGEVYSHGRIPAQQAKVEVLDPHGKKLGETTTDDKGVFTYEARFRCDHRLVAKTGDGHAAECVVTAAELPGNLPTRDGSPGNASSADDTQLQAVAQQVAALRRELQADRDRTRLTDVVGGIGYILGITGLLFYLLGVRKKGRAGDEP